MLCEMQIRALCFEETVCVPGSVLVLGCSWRLVNTIQKMDGETLPKSSKQCLEGAKIMKNGAQIHAKSIKNGLGGARVPFGRVSWPMGERSNLIFVIFVKKSEILGAIFGAKMVPKSC